MEYLTTAEVSKILKVNVRTVIRMIERGELRAIRVGKLWRISKNDNPILGGK